MRREEVAGGCVGDEWCWVLNRYGCECSRVTNT